MLNKITLVTLCALAVAASLLVQPALATEPSYTQVVQLKNGKVRGLVVDVGEQKKIESFQGIRFGTAARFEKPRFVDSWTDIYNATRQRDACPQFGHPELDVSMKNVTTSEDCLFLNIHRPVGEGTGRTVMVWIHGGAFEIGSIFSGLYNGQHFTADEGVIFVSIAYRLGPLGFLSGGGVPPNLGLHDQILALKWVQENIAAFGGDPAKVTIFGESAGGMSVGALVLSPLAKGLFIRAIAQSGAPLTFVDSQAESLERTKKFAPKVSCSDADLQKMVQCIKGKSAAELFPPTKNDLPRDELFKPVYGDELLPLKPSTALSSGQVNQVDFIYGVTRDEGSFFLPIFFPELGKADTNLTVQSSKEYICKIMTLYKKGAHSKAIADYYIDRLNNPTQDDYKIAISAVIGDMLLTCPTVLFGEELARQLPVSKHVYAYRLMQAVPDNVVPGFSFPRWMGVSHGQDVFYLFLPQLLKNFREARQLSHRMVEDWTVFAKAGRPENALWKEAVNRVEGNFNTTYLHFESGQMKFVAGGFTELCGRVWKPIILA